MGLCVVIVGTAGAFLSGFWVDRTGAILGTTRVVFVMSPAFVPPAPDSDSLSSWVCTYCGHQPRVRTSGRDGLSCARSPVGGGAERVSAGVGLRAHLGRGGGAGGRARGSAHPNYGDTLTSHCGARFVCHAVALFATHFEATSIGEAESGGR